MRSTPEQYDIRKHGVVDAETRNVFGWAYIIKGVDGQVIIDRQGDFIDQDEVLEKAAYDFVIDARSADVMHNEQKIGTLIESVVFTPEKVAKMHIPEGVLPTGWWVGFHVDDDKVWKRVKNGDLRAFSIGGKGIREKV